jgi:hypothetical protein
MNTEQLAWLHLKSHLVLALAFSAGTINLQVAASGTNGNTISWTDGLVVDNSGNVGIGTSTVHADLHLGAASPHIDIGPSAGNRGKVGFDSNNVYIGSTSGTGEIHFKNNIGSTDAPQASGDTKMVITDSGVGIGTTSPTSYNSKADDLVVLTSGDTGISVVSGTSSEGAIVFADGTTGGDPLRGRIRYSHSTDSMDFRVNNAEAMRIDSSGNLLVGTTNANPTSSGVNDPGVELSNTGGVRSTVASNPAATFNRKTDDGHVVLFRKDGTTVGSIGTSGGYTHFISGTGGIRPIDNTQLRPVNSDGSASDNTMDLGTSGIRFKDLYLSGTANASKTRLTTNNTTYWDLRRDSSTGDFVVSDDGLGDVLTILQSNGNVGIGTSSPAYTLDVNGDVRFYDASGSSANYYFESDHYSQINIVSDKDASAGGPYNTAITANGANGNLELRTNNLQRVSIDQSGLVGIGTTSPSTPLDVSGAATIDGLVLQDSSDRSGLLEISTSLGTWVGIQIKPTSTSRWSVMGDQDDFGLYDDYNGEWILLHNENSNTLLYHNGTSKFSTLSSGAEVYGTLYAKNFDEGTASISGTSVALNPATGSIQRCTLSANTTFTDNISAGESMTLRITNGTAYTITWPTMTWITSAGNVAPTLNGTDDVFVFWNDFTGLYGAYAGHGA